MRVRVKLTLLCEEGPEALGFGRGIVQLLRAVEETGSIRRACAAMNMAYSKAWRILTATEREFHTVLLTRNGREGSLLTAEARLLLEEYDRLLALARDAAEAGLSKDLEERIQRKE